MKESEQKFNVGGLNASEKSVGLNSVNNEPDDSDGLHYIELLLDPVKVVAKAVHHGKP